ncbi:SpoIIE family protein phosphatase [Micromonospora sp. NPDC050397]|uniref:ATP-binding SpoIIE family protein phosphatase n=1 Tax=Micromonospora sp. NPDC050397 TaxID=3364279 RepID=UPI00384CB618
MSSGPAGDGRRRDADLVRGARRIPGDIDPVAGGDWYDVVTRRDGQLVLVVGEVLDTGVLAVAAMGQLRTALLAHLLAGVPPGTALTLLDRQFGNARHRWDVIALCLQFDPRTGALCYASAGHPSPICVGPEGQVDVLYRRPLGPPIGTRPEVGHRSVETVLPPGARLLFHPPRPVAAPSGGPPPGSGSPRTRRPAGPAGRRGLVTGRPGRPEVSHPVDATGSRSPADDLVDGVSPLDTRGLTIQAAGESSAPVAAVPYGPPGEQIEELVQVRFVQAPRRPRAEEMAILLLAQSTPDRLVLRLPADPTKLSPLRERLLDFLAAHQVGEADSFDLVVAVSEAAANAIEHPVAPAEGTIMVEVAVADGVVAATVRDSGRWRESDDPGFRGRGLALIRSLGELSVNRTATGTEVTFWRRLAT